MCAKATREALPPVCMPGFDESVPSLSCRSDVFIVVVVVHTHRCPWACKELIYLHKKMKTFIYICLGEKICPFLDETVLN